MPYKNVADQAKFYQNNKEWLDLYNREWTHIQRLRLICSFGGKCTKCGEPDSEVLDFDHINDDGHTETGKNIIFSVKANPSRFQLLCKNCNWRKELRRRKNAIQERQTS